MKKILLIFIAALFAVSVSAAKFSAIYATGDAFGGWSNTNPKTFTAVEDGIFVWSGPLLQGDFKILLTLGSWTNCLNASTENEAVVIGQEHTLVHVPNYLEPDTGEDYKFINQTPGEYLITIDTENMKMTITNRIVMDLPDDLWIIGSAVMGGKAKLEKDPEIVGKFTFKGELFKNGTFKIASTETPNAETKYILPITENVNAQGVSRIKISDNTAENGWVVSEGYKYYTLTIDGGTQLFEGEKFNLNVTELFLAGGVTGGWNPYIAPKFYQDLEDPVIFTFIGRLAINTEGEEPNLFKILLQREWGPYSFHPQTANEPIAEGISKYTKDAVKDYKWLLPADREGDYSIRINVFTETMEVAFLLPLSVNAKNGDKNYMCYQQNSSLCVVASDDMLISSVVLMDITGKRIAQKTNISGNFTIGNNLKSGIYVLLMESNGKKYTEKVMVF